MRIYLSTSWKNADRVRLLAQVLRAMGHEPYDFTDPNCRTEPEIPPESHLAPYDPAKGSYEEYLRAEPRFLAAVRGNRAALDRCDLVVLLLPCGNDAHADWAYGVGKGKPSYVVGAPPAGDRSPTHLWADTFFKSEWELVGKLAADAPTTKKADSLSPCHRFRGNVSLQVIAPDGSTKHYQGGSVICRSEPYWKAGQHISHHKVVVEGAVAWQPEKSEIVDCQAPGEVVVIPPPCPTNQPQSSKICTQENLCTTCYIIGAAGCGEPS